MELQDQTRIQKKIMFAQSEHVAAAIEILRDLCQQEALVGATEWETLRNAVAMDTRGQMLLDFITSVNNIKSGQLLTTESK